MTTKDRSYDILDVVSSTPRTRKVGTYSDCNNIGDYVEIEGHGRVAQIYGAHLPEFRNLGRGLVSAVGFLSGERFALETTILGLYPEFAQTCLVKDQTAKTNSHLRSLGESLEAMRSVSTSESVDRCIVALGPWDANYQHFLVETYPRIWFAAKNNNGNSLPIVVLDHRHTRDIIQTGLPHVNAIYLSKHELLRVNRDAMYCMPFGQNMWPLTQPQRLALQNLRLVVTSAEIKGDHSAPTRVFLDRRTVTSNVGMKRVMTNHTAILEILESRDFEKVYLEEKSLLEKRAILRNAEFVVSPIGANLMNLLFLEPGAKVMIIGHPHCGVFSFFADFFDQLGVGITEIELLTHTSIADASGPLSNAPYRVNPIEFSSLLDKMLSRE